MHLSILLSVIAIVVNPILAIAISAFYKLRAQRFQCLFFLATILALAYLVIGLSSPGTSDIWYIIAIVKDNNVPLEDLKLARLVYGKLFHELPGVTYPYLTIFLGILSILIYLRKLEKMSPNYLGNANTSSYWVFILFLPLSYGASFEFIAASAISNLGIVYWLDKRNIRGGTLVLMATAVHTVSALYFLVYFISRVLKPANILALIIILPIVAYLLYLSTFYAGSENIFINYFFTKIAIYTTGVWSKYSGMTEHVNLVVVVMRLLAIGILLWGIRAHIPRNSVLSGLFRYSCLLLIIFVIFSPFRTLGLRFSDYGAIYLVAIIYFLGQVKPLKKKILSNLLLAVFLSLLIRPVDALYVKGTDHAMVNIFTNFTGLLLLNDNFTYKEHNRSKRRWEITGE